MLYFREELELKLLEANKKISSQQEILNKKGKNIRIMIFKNIFLREWLFILSPLKLNHNYFEVIKQANHIFDFQESGTNLFNVLVVY